MIPPTPEPGTSPSQRTLAAIVFTDVVSFSSRMHADEVGTLKLLQRDFAEMRRLCAEHEGAVLKTTGDGLLLTFTSAVQAVACALAMQRKFAADAKVPDSGDALQHRIGIHLGDVLVQDKDVMGDGVNIASRLQAEAEPGGICISQTVYDVVKNKLEMKAVSLGARDLKNIAEAMPVYSLLLEAQALAPGERAPLSPKEKQAADSSRRALVAWGAAVLAAAVLAAVLIMRNRAPATTTVVAAPPAVAPATPSPAPQPAAPKVAAGPDLAHDLSEGYAKHRDAIQELHTLYLDKYDFKGLVIALRDKGESASAPPAIKQLLRAAEQLVRLRSWLEVALTRYGKLHALHVKDLSGDASKDAEVYLSPDDRVVFTRTTGSVARDWSEVPPGELGAVIVSALHDAKETRRPMVQGAMTFGRLYSLPQMTSALDGSKPRGLEAPAPTQEPQR